MSDNHGKSDDKKWGGSSMDFGITSMIGGFFGLASGSSAVKTYVEGGGGWHDHH